MRQDSGFGARVWIRLEQMAAGKLVGKLKKPALFKNKKSPSIAERALKE